MAQKNEPDYRRRVRGSLAAFARAPAQVNPVGWPTALRFLALVVIAAFSLVAWVFPGLTEALASSSDGQEPRLIAETALLLDLDSGRVLWSKDPDRQMAPASTTKILTALVALETGRLDDVATVSQRAAATDGTRVYLVSGEKHTLRKLLQAMLIHSANDAAVAVAEHVGGNVENFARLMNDRARRVGALNSNFVNPNGLPAENHYSTARDLALIAREAMGNPMFREIVQTRYLDWQGVGWQSGLVNINKFLFNYEGASGIKTGYTSVAGQCLVASAARGGMSLVAVLLKGGPQIWEDAATLLDYGFTRFKPLRLASRGEVVSDIRLPSGEKIAAVAAEDLIVAWRGDEDPVPRSRLNVNLPPLPVSRGDVLGDVSYLGGSETWGQVKLLAGNEALAAVAPHRSIRWWPGLFWAAVVVGAYLLLVRLRLRVARRYRYVGRQTWRSYR